MRDARRRRSGSGRGRRIGRSKHPLAYGEGVPILLAQAQMRTMKAPIHKERAQ